MKFKKVIMPLLQAAVTFLLLWWIFHDPAKRHQMAAGLQNANPWWLIPGFLFFGIVLATATIRWRLLLAVQNIDFGWRRTWQLVMIGMFFNLFLIGSVGGDVLKIFYAMREVPKQKAAVFLSIVVDRIVGVFSLMIVTLLICFFSFSQLWATPVIRGLFSTVLAFFGGFFVVLILSLIVNRFHFWKWIPQWMPGHRMMMDMAAAFSSYASSGRILSKTVVISLVGNFFLFGSAIFAAYSFAALPGAPGAGPMIVVMPIVNTISAMPISLSGIGVREGLFETLLNTLYGTPKSLAVLISLTGFSLWVLWGLIGGVVYFFYRPSMGEAVSLHEMTEQVESVEEAVEEKVD